ncbi:DUF1674 domain-containing protein [Oceanibaculum nanhaiense]|jgi:hypothetical protein|uniref:DUF1674 domain-containing protein n=1 Tax=Oceanibaculum nanhaiense TaxID=1909734 RepID=UPI000A387FD2|nr:succinate dehydrogenase assembly factor 4 [Oceanibaculum nanhaiense]MBC7134873.1 DUF1674 domain-containing protein [Oceanibaculum nanhaiense]
MTENKPDQTPKPAFRERKLEGGKRQPQPEAKPPEDKTTMPKEIGGPAGPEPTRYGDWAFKGRVTDF